MRGYMFRSRWGALAFVVLSAVGAASLIGGEEDKGVLLNAAHDIQQQRSAMEATMAGEEPPPIAVPSGAAAEFTSDEELIEDAAGFDPTPIEDAAAPPAEVVPQDEVVIVSRDAGAAEQ